MPGRGCQGGVRLSVAFSSGSQVGRHAGRNWAVISQVSPVNRSISQSIITMIAIAEAQRAWYRVHVQVPTTHSHSRISSARSIQSRRVVWLYRIEALSSFLLRSSCLLAPLPPSSTADATSATARHSNAAHNPSSLDHLIFVCAPAVCAVILHHPLLFI